MKLWLSFCTIALICFISVPALAQSREEIEILRMFYKEEDLVVSATRNEKPVTQVAENITIVTAEEIEDMNAHTLTDVLNTIPGVQVDTRGGPGSANTVVIQGSDTRHVLVLVDGVTLNNLSDNFPDAGAVTVQNIRRIEIIKGPASSSWGSSLGGVINIITKPAGDSVRPGGTLSASYGERGTGDFRAEISGRGGPVGYYLSAGRLQSDGFTPNTDAENNSFYTKIRAELTEKTSLSFTMGYNEGGRGLGRNTKFSFENEFEYVFSTLTLDSALTGSTTLSASLRKSAQDTEFVYNLLATGAEFAKVSSDDDSTGASLKLTSKLGAHTLSMGADYDNGELVSDNVAGEKRRLEKWAVFANDTIAFDRLSITPGIRYDDISTSGNFVSPSLGATYALGRKSLLRIAVARGFNAPPLSATFGGGFFYNPNPDLKEEKVWSYQAGAETAALPYLWVKATAFRHDISDAIDDEPEAGGKFTQVNRDRIRRQGVELDVETTPVFNTALRGGFTFQDVKNREKDETIINVPRYTCDIGLRYDDGNFLKGLLSGHYIWWNADSSFGGEYDTFIWDLNLITRLPGTGGAAEIFLTVHNVFDGSQYFLSEWKNPGRWVEGGARYKF